MGKIRNLCMTQLVRMKKIKEPDMYTWIFSSVDNCYYNYNSRYLFEYVKEHLPQDVYKRQLQEVQESGFL